jgi:membrane-anchored protein YejM (alkaline phosphatase superfamily)
VEERPTSHLDLSVTVAELLGADPAARAQWSLGENLLAPPPARARVVSGWDTLGVYTSDVILEVPMAGYGGAEIAVYDGRWQRRFDDEEILAREGKVLGKLALECRRFLR